MSQQPLTVLVSGGGPVGLTFSLNLTMLMGKHAKIVIYEPRWIVNEYDRISWQEESDRKGRCDDIITLQDHVIDQLPVYVRQSLVRDTDERVWPMSRNISIRDIEDRLLTLIQPFVQSGQVELIPEPLHERTDRFIKGNFDLLVGADGSSSFVRRYCNIEMISEGVEYACGLAYNIPSKVATQFDEPLHQALNCILSVSQTRYLVNSNHSRQGFMYIRLLENEYDELRERVQHIINSNEPLYLSDFQKCPESLIWTTIRQGLDFFQIASKFVYRLKPVEIHIRYASVVVRELRFEIKNDEPPMKPHLNDQRKTYKIVLACLVGDAAFNTHFWVRRGMNNGISAAIALARNIVCSCTVPNASSGPSKIVVRTPLNSLDFLDYQAFIARLRAREQQHNHSLNILIDSSEPNVESSYVYVHSNHSYEDCKTILFKKLQKTRHYFQERKGWPHVSRPIIDEELEDAANRIRPDGVAQLGLRNLWTTQHIDGKEVLVLVQDMYPFPNQYFSSISSPSSPRSPLIFALKKYSTSHRTLRLHLILWIGENNPQKLIESLQNAARSGHLSSLHMAKNLPEVKQWMVDFRHRISREDILLKVIIGELGDMTTPTVNMIRAVRSAERAPSNVPILLLTGNKDQNVLAALELPNVMLSVMDYDLYEFVGIKLNEQWHEGWPVIETQINSSAASASHTTTLPQCPLPYPISDTLSTMPLPPLSPRPLLLWIDSAENDSAAVEAIGNAHPHLELLFKPNFFSAHQYLLTQSQELKCRKLIVVCKGYYVAPENKNVIDVINLFDTKFAFLNVPICVYTGNRERLLEQSQNIPLDRVVVTDQRDELLSFIRNTSITTWL